MDTPCVCSYFLYSFCYRLLLSQWRFYSVCSISVLSNLSDVSLVFSSFICISFCALHVLQLFARGSYSYFCLFSYYSFILIVL